MKKLWMALAGTVLGIVGCGSGGGGGGTNEPGLTEESPEAEVRLSDAILFLDRNSNGVIEEGDLFYGFDQLALLDSNSDGRIDDRDRLFTTLRLWMDRNQDGRLDPGEWLTLTEAGVWAIGVQFIITGDAQVPARGVYNPTAFFEGPVVGAVSALGLLVLDLDKDGLSLEPVQQTIAALFEE